jgi:hypothetical protein
MPTTHLHASNGQVHKDNAGIMQYDVIAVLKDLDKQKVKMQ